MAVIKKKSLVDQVYETLREEILTLRLPLGAKVNVNELQGSLGVSCTPIREAVNRLQQEGLVVYENNVGAHVLTLDAHDVEEIQQLAMTLHCAAIRLAMERGDRAVMTAALEKHLEEYRQAKSAQSEVSAVNRFIGVFYRSCGNQRLDRSMVSIQGQQLLLRAIYAAGSKVRGADAEALRNVIDRVTAGDTQGVCDALQAYTDHLSARVLALLQENTAGQ